VSETTNQITRREILKRGAFVGGAVLWVTPVVQTLGMSSALAQTPSDICTPSCAVSVVDKLQKDTRLNGAITDPLRSNPDNALGPKDGKFFSLGYGGWIVLELGHGYFSGKGGEALVIETTLGASEYPLEKADIFVSDVPNPATWHWIGEATNKNSGSDLTKTTINLDSVLGVNELVKYVKLVDTTNPADHTADSPTGSSDGFDVDSVCISCPTIPQ